MKAISILIGVSIITLGVIGESALYWRHQEKVTEQATLPMTSQVIENQKQMAVEINKIVANLQAQITELKEGIPVKK